MTTGRPCFFGAGVSLAAGFPSWHSLLTESFKLDANLVEDEDLKNDPLTLAELAGQVLGNERLQRQLREVFDAEKPYPKSPTTNHFLLARLGCRVYVTTNYDALFEKAWPGVRKEKLFVATNDTHIEEAIEIIEGKRSGAVLFKIHGCVSKESEHLILTRRDYRHHYRANLKFFLTIIRLLRERHTLFVGFSHRDPEVSRLVDDAIHQFESEKLQQERDSDGVKTTPILAWPQLYSLQFDMRSHTPEIFAARGIVALNPPPMIGVEPKLMRSRALSASLCDLVVSKSLGTHTDESAQLDKDLAELAGRIQRPLHTALGRLQSHNSVAIAQEKSDTAPDWLTKLRNDLGPLASQGVFLVDDEGMLLCCSLGENLSKGREALLRNLGVRNRPYFQIANSFRNGFVSDLSASIFNGQGTFFLCQPLLKAQKVRGGVEETHFAGLLFSASQIGQWLVPLETAQNAWSRNLGFILVDSNGTCLLPAFNEFPTTSVPWKVPQFDTIEESSPDVNRGYAYSGLVALSRRDQLVRHIAKSVVPIQQDDDVLALASDASYYTVVTEIAKTRWKLALTRPITK